jgi:hypothetical protein
VHTVQTFATSLPPFGRYFAYLLASAKFFEAQYKNLLHFLEGGGVKPFLSLKACCCQKFSSMTERKVGIYIILQSNKKTVATTLYPSISHHICGN